MTVRFTFRLLSFGTWRRFISQAVVEKWMENPQSQSRDWLAWEPDSERLYMVIKEEFAGLCGHEWLRLKLVPTR